MSDDDKKKKKVGDKELQLRALKERQANEREAKLKKEKSK